MKKLLAVLAGTILTVALAHAQKQINDPNAEPRNVSGFHAIKVSSAFDVYLTQGNEEGLAVSASEPKYRNDIKTEVKNGVLVISFQGDKKFWNKGNKKLKAYISFKNIDRLDVGGACDVYLLTALKADKLSIELSGASDMKNAELQVNELTVDVNGASDMLVSGKVSQLKIEASGASDFKGYDLVTEYCDVRASGASGISITVNKELSAKASGASDIRYKGEGLIREIKTSGASSVSRKS